MDKIERLLNLTMVLLNTARPLTAAEIRDRVPGYADNDDSFKRAFERDKTTLRSLGIPLQRSEITHSNPPADGYRIRPEDYYLRDPGFTPDEIAALHLAVASVPMVGARGLEAFWSLGGVAGADVGDTTPVGHLPADPRLGALFSALTERRVATFEYGEVRRGVEPHRLDFQKGRWYLTGFDRTREAVRIFRVDRIEGAVAVGATKSFERPEARDFELGDPWSYGGGPPTAVTLRIDIDHVGALDRLSPTGVAVQDMHDGTVEATFDVVNWPAFRSFVLGFLDHAEVVSPPESRDAMIDWLRAFRAPVGHP